MKQETPPSYSIVALKDNTVTAVESKEVQQDMTVLEETNNQDRLQEKVTYWNTIYNNITPEEVKLYHFYNEKRNLHLWSIYDSLSKIKGIRRRSEYKPMPD